MGNGKFTLQGDMWTTMDLELKKGKKIPTIVAEIFLGENDQPSMTSKVSLENLLDYYIESNMVPNGTINQKDRYDVLNFLELIQDLVDKKIVKVNSLPDVDEVIKKKSSKKKTK